MNKELLILVSGLWKFQTLVFSVNSNMVGIFGFCVPPSSLSLYWQKHRCL